MRSMVGQTGGWRRTEAADVTLLRCLGLQIQIEFWNIFFAGGGLENEKAAGLKKKMKMQFGWFITHFICESHNKAMTLKWKSISVNPF